MPKASSHWFKRIRLAGLLTLVPLLVALFVGGRWLLSPPTDPGIINEAQGLRIALDLQRGPQGLWRADIRLRNQAGEPVVARAVSARFTMPFICTDQIDTALLPVADGYFRAEELFFSMSGVWTVDVMIQQDELRIVQTTFGVPVTVSEELALRTPTPLPGVPANAALRAGKLVYDTHCLRCHGASGAGDGPEAAGLVPPPADFRVHMAFGKHSDPQVFLIIHGGRPSTPMPAFGDTLTTDQIWQVIAYLRTFAQTEQNNAIPGQNLDKQE